MSDQPEVPVCRENSTMIVHSTPLSTGSDNTKSYNYTQTTTGATNADVLIFAMQHPEVALSLVFGITVVFLVVVGCTKSLITHGKKEGIKTFSLSIGEKSLSVTAKYKEIIKDDVLNVSPISIYQKIIARLDAANIEYHTEHHEPTLTSADASRVRGVEMHAGAKAIVTKGHKTGTYYLFVMPADLKLDNAKAKDATGEGVGCVSDPFEVTGCVPVSVQSYGFILNII